MKKSPFALSIVSAILALGAGALLIFLPNICSELAPYMSANFQHDLVNGFYNAFKATITFGVGSVVFSSVVVGLLGFVFIFWLWHFIMICVTKRADSLMTNLFWLIFGVVDVYVAFAFIGFANSSTGYVFNGTLNGKNITNGISLISNLTGAGLFENFKSIAILCAILLLALISLILGFIAVIKAIHNDRVYPNVSLDDEEEEKADKKEEKPAEKTTNTFQDDKKNPVIVQNITYSGKGEPAPAQQSVPPYPYAYAYPYGAMFPPPPAPKEEPKKEESKPLTEEDVRKIISEALAAQQAQFFAYTQAAQKPVEEPKEEVKEEKKVEQPEVEDRPLTAKELRSIIKNELRDHDHPEELLPLTDEQCRALIRDELEEYYASTRPNKEPKEEIKEEPKAEPAKEDVEEDFMTADELSKMIRNEVVQIVGERPVEETITIDMVKDAINDALASYKPEIETLSKEDVSSIVKEELASTNDALASTNEALNSAKDELSATKDGLNSVKDELASTKENLASVKEELASTRNELASAKEEEAKQTDSLYALKEQTFKNEYQAKFDSAKNAEAIESLRKSQLYADDIRTIISDELDKKLATLEPKVVEKVVEVEKTPEPAPEIVPEAKEEPVVVEPAPEETVAAPDTEKAARVPFANRVLALDDEVKEYYNELKEEAVSYGLKSRLSISGDTFRLHTKTYFKMIVAGKGLKLYMALDPHDYKDSTIPVKDAGTKNLYKDIPLVFKVKSPLSLKRAKILIKDVCEKDGLVKQDIEHFNYVSQLDSYRVSGGNEEEEADEEE